MSHSSNTAHQHNNNMRCHYEVLELERHATHEEIKKNYRKLALFWHPDKNFNSEESTSRCKEINHAYSILSDRNEKKWYDDHREEILYGQDKPNNNNDSDDDGEKSGQTSSKKRRYGRSVNVWPYFSYQYADDVSFYETVQTIFHNIEQAELEVNPSIQRAPPLHTSDETTTSSTSANTIKNKATGMLSFYAFWSNFVSNLSFAWLDEYNTTEGDNRDMRRAMEKENKKIRDKGRNEYTSQVRSLAQYLKRQDPRYIAYLRQEQLRKKQLVVDIEMKKKQQIQQRKELKSVGLSIDEQIRRDEERSRSFLFADDEDDSSNSNEGVGEGRKKRAGEGRKKRAGEGRKKDFISPTSTTGTSSTRDQTSRDTLHSTMSNLSLDPLDNHSTEDIVYKCEACVKEFKTSIQLAQHEASKVHRKQVQLLQQQQQQQKKKGGGGGGKATMALTSAISASTATVTVSASEEENSMTSTARDDVP